MQGCWYRAEKAGQGHRWPYLAIRLYGLAELRCGDCRQDSWGAPCKHEQEGTRQAGGRFDRCLSRLKQTVSSRPMLLFVPRGETMPHCVPSKREWH